MILGWKKPALISNYPSVTLYYPFLRDNIFTQTWVIVNKYYFHYPFVSHEHLNRWISTICLYLLLTPNFAKAHRNWTLYVHKTIITHTFHCDLLPPHAPPCPLPITTVTLNKFCSKIIDYWSNWGVTWVINLLGVSYPWKRGNENE